MVPLAETGTQRGGIRFQHEFKEPTRYTNGSIDWRDMALECENSTSCKATSWNNEFHNLITLCVQETIFLFPSSIMISHKTTKSRKKIISLLALSSLPVRKKDLFQRLSH